MESAELAQRQRRQYIYCHYSYQQNVADTFFACLLLVADVQGASAARLAMRLLAPLVLNIRYCDEAFYLHAYDRNKRYKRR